MNQIMIRVLELSKRFRYRSERSTSFKTLLVNFASGKLNRTQYHEFDALKNITFEIRTGEFVGIMGRNGAGKSTLLKLLSGIYSPSGGEIQIAGAIAPLIELGAGFHPDLSGLENIFLNASILGFGRKATQAAVPSIIEFSELGEKINMPIKNYSSGMLVRLGFSIATHLDAPILLVDEILAVGDAGFQSKCLNKINELHRAGRTIVLITHDAAVVEATCSRCIVIDKQGLIYDGSARDGAQVYRDLFQ